MSHTTPSSSASSTVDVALTDSIISSSDFKADCIGFQKPELAVIGGTSFLKSNCLNALQQKVIENSRRQKIRVWLHPEKPLVFIQRHQCNPYKPFCAPQDIPYGDIALLLKEIGVKRVVSFASVGSLRLDVPTQSVVVPDDFFCPFKITAIDSSSRSCFFIPTLLTPLRRRVLEILRREAQCGERQCGKDDRHTLPIPVDGGTYVNGLGPRFETKSEVRWMASEAIGGVVVGMTAGHELPALQEVGDLDYALLCIVDNMAHGIPDQKTKSTTLTSSQIDAALHNHLPLADLLLSKVLAGLLPSADEEKA